MVTFYRIVKIQQQGETSLTATIPNDIAEKMELSKGQYMKIYLKDDKIVIEKNE
jgi:antitoxin component of MazEF toxin-antitoxin module